MKIGGLFFGYGGLDMAVQEVLGGELAWVSEIDKGACKIIAHRHPGVPNIGDITKVDWSQIEPVDILTGGSPCQDLSHAGKRAGMTEGTRSNLWVAMREAIAQLRPSLVVWENVRGAGSAEADSALEFCAGCMGEGRLDSGPVLRALGRVVGDLADLGYVGSFHGLRAADVGAPHGRFRYFVAAYPAGERWTGPEQPRAHVEHDGQESSHPRQDGATLLPTPRATDGTKGGPNQRGSSGDLMLPSAVTLLPTPAVNDMGASYTPDEWDAWTERMKSEHGNGNGHGKSLSIEAQRLLPTPNAGDAKQGYVSAEDHAARKARKASDGIHLQDDLPQVVTTVQAWGDYSAAITRWELLTRPAPAPTMTSAKGNPQLSPAFAEWMMGLPAGHVTDVPGITRNEALKACGNGVVPQQAAEALRIMLARAAA